MGPRGDDEIISLGAASPSPGSGGGIYPLYLTKRRRPRKIRRLVRKNGSKGVHRCSRQFVVLRYLNDLATTLTNSDWKWTLAILSFAFVLTWTMFACLWMVVAMSNGDLDGNGLEPCLGGIQGFAGYFLFSIETQATIGYGTRYITHHCPEAVFVLCLQVMVGMAVCAVVLGVVYEKIKGPGRLQPRDCFSRFAVICQRDGELCLIFRVRDRDRRHQCRNEIKAFLVQNRRRVQLRSLKLQATGILIWPLEVVHRINERSPFYNLSARDLIMKTFEILVVMEGTSLSTCSTSSSSASYLSSEILWGHAFLPCVQYDRDLQAYVIDHKNFNRTREVLMPLCSAQRLQEVFEEVSSSNFFSSLSSATVSPVTVHSSASGARAEEETSSVEDAEAYCEGVDPLLASLQRFIREEQFRKQGVKETPF